MAKQSSTNFDNAQAEISVFAFSVRGDSSVVINALQTFAKQAVSFQPPRGPAAPKHPPTVASPALNLNNAPDAASSEPTEMSLSQEDSPTTQAGDVRAQKAPRRRNGFAPPKIVDALRANEGPVSFKDFVGTRTLTTDAMKVIFVATWLRDHRQVEKFGVNELFTCYRMVNWTLPMDPGQPLRNAAKTTLQYLRSEGDGLYSLTTGGMKKFAEAGQ